MGIIANLTPSSQKTRLRALFAVVGAQNRPRAHQEHQIPASGILWCQVVHNRQSDGTSEGRTLPLPGPEVRL